MNKYEQMKITMNCAQKEGELVFLQEIFTETYISYEFKIDTPYSCIEGGDSDNLGGLGYLGLVLILLIVLLGLYFAIGYFVNCLVLNKEGGWKYTQLPQFKIWKTIFELAWEGILFIKEGIQTLIFKFILKRAVYDQI